MIGSIGLKLLIKCDMPALKYLYLSTLYILYVLVAKCCLGDEGVKYITKSGHWVRLSILWLGMCFREFIYIYRWELCWVGWVSGY